MSWNTRMCAFFISALFASEFPVCRLREKFGVKLAEICRRIRCPCRNALLVIRFSNFSS